MMKSSVVVLALISMLFVAAIPAVAASPQVSVTNNVMAESIINGSKGVRIDKAIMGFKAGTVAEFQSLTTFLIAEPGIYTLRLDIYGPDNKVRASYGPQSMEAKTANWTHNQLTYWRAVNFNTSGVYHFMVRVNNQLIADFPISTTN